METLDGNILSSALPSIYFTEGTFTKNLSKCNLGRVDDGSLVRHRVTALCTVHLWHERAEASLRHEKEMLSRYVAWLLTHDKYASMLTRLKDVLSFLKLLFGLDFGLNQVDMS